MVTPEQKARMRQTLEDALRVVEALGVTTSCRFCEYMVDGYCQRWNAQVPKDQIEHGCNEFMERIPF